MNASLYLTASPATNCAPSAMLLLTSIVDNGTAEGVQLEREAASREQSELIQHWLEAENPAIKVHHAALYELGLLSRCRLARQLQPLLSRDPDSHKYGLHAQYRTSVQAGRKEEVRCGGVRAFVITSVSAARCSPCTTSPWSRLCLFPPNGGPTNELNPN